MSAMTKREWMAYLEKTWDAAQKEAWADQQPTKREWVGLTDEEVNELVSRFKRYSYVLLREVELKLKEKNGG